jgi:DNA-binding HxlR family transcriptional regulator
MTTTFDPARRSDCPVNAFVEIFGDRWSLLIVRDLMLLGFTSYGQLQSSKEGIATNILAERLERLAAMGIIERGRDAADGRRVGYRLTEKGIDLAPAIVELMRWSYVHEPTRGPRKLVVALKKHPEAFVAEIRRRWRDGTSEWLLREAPTPASPRRRGKRATGARGGTRRKRRKRRTA